MPPAIDYKERFQALPSDGTPIDVAVAWPDLNAEERKMVAFMFVSLKTCSISYGPGLQVNIQLTPAGIRALLVL